LSPGKQRNAESESNQGEPNRVTPPVTSENTIQTQSSPEREPRANAQENGHNTQPDNWFTKQNAPDWIMAIITAIGAAVAYRQFKQAEDAVLKTQRAYVLLDEVSMRPQVNPLTNETLIGFKVRNYGPTAATHVTFTIFELKIAGEPQHPNAPLPISAIPPNEFISPTFTVLRMMFKPEAISAASRGEKELTFNLAFTYRDVFGITHRSESTGVYYGPAPAGFIIVSNEEHPTSASDQPRHENGQPHA